MHQEFMKSTDISEMHREFPNCVENVSYNVISQYLIWDELSKTMNEVGKVKIKKTWKS